MTTVILTCSTALTSRAVGARDGELFRAYFHQLKGIAPVIRRRFVQRIGRSCYLKSPVIFWSNILCIHANAPLRWVLHYAILSLG